MKRLAVVLATAAAVAVGALARPAPHGDPTMTPREAARAWAGANGMTPRNSEDLTRDGLYAIHRFSTSAGCEVIAAPLGRVDEILPLVRARLSETAWTDRRMLIASVGPMPAGALEIQLRRLLARFSVGHAPQAVLLTADRGCLPEGFWDHLSEWPAP
ncbi:hypothetical protein DFR50_1346 [Roseiarcus fermentans]|uniref:Uncharacterized protein n=1 Tax=Roseiarcus fermentans TaxID=1473586 RepID=A0A366ETA6_9HYPH|nr:hypothetical protein [Roseiarcus fermentans]RBP05643.1 hypothetical protein DFR50_1346 [Roseiarcus fermentans]